MNVEIFVNVHCVTVTVTVMPCGSRLQIADLGDHRP